MLELPSHLFSSIIPFLNTIPQPVLPRAVAEGRTPGRVFIESTDCQAAVVWLPCGYLYLMGEPGRIAPGDLGGLFSKQLIPAWREVGETGYIIAPFSKTWADLLDEMLADEPHADIYRRAFSFDKERFQEHLGIIPPLPFGFELLRMDAALAEALGAARTWNSMMEFESHGIGYVIKHQGEVVSACFSVFGCSTGLEIDVHTAEPYRGLGLATHAAAAFIRECLESGQTPNWECFWDNVPSGKLAERLGFSRKLDYPVIYWEPRFA